MNIKYKILTPNPLPMYYELENRGPGMGCDTPLALACTGARQGGREKSELETGGGMGTDNHGPGMGCNIPLTLVLAYTGA